MKPKTEVAKAKERELAAWVKSLPALAESDYSKGFSGTKMDTMLEKAFTEILKGVEDIALRDRFPVGPCTCSMDGAGNHSADCEGRWIRVMGRSSCWLYVHTVTHCITGVQPSTYEPDDAKAQLRAQRVAAARGPQSSTPSCHPGGVVDSIRAIHQEGKTPVIIADQPGVRELVVNAVSGAGGLVISTRPFVLAASRTGIKFEDHFVAMMQQITAAVKMGGLVVIDVEDSSPHFIDKLHGNPKYRSKFPDQVWNPRATAWAKDLAFGKPPAPGFGMVLLTSLGVSEYERELKDKVPWSLMKGVRATTFVRADIIVMPELAHALEETDSSCRVPLLLDASGQGLVDTFLSYSPRTQAVDVMQLLGSARTTEEMREVLRSQLVACIKAGDTLLLRLRDGTPDLNLLMNDDQFPSAVFTHGQVTSAMWLERLYRDADKEHGVAVARPGYRLVITSNQPLESFAATLSPGLPIWNLRTICVELEEED